MKRLLLVLLVILMVLLLAGCGSTFIISGALLADTSQTASGLVSIVHLSINSNPGGTSVYITVVTLIDAGAARTLNFCGNQVSLFPPGSSVTATFQPGQPCSTISTVVKN